MGPVHGDKKKFPDDVAELHRRDRPAEIEPIFSATVMFTLAQALSDCTWYGRLGGSQVS